MNWSEVLEDSSLRQLPFKIETNGWGQVLLTPIDTTHSRLQGQLIGQLHRLTHGRGTIISESPIETSDGVKVADTVWTTREFDDTREIEPVFATSPELCVEIHNLRVRPEMHLAKKALYFEQGATEVWICDLKGQFSFYDVHGEIVSSRLFPEFPKLMH